jgi:hypothetical protein
MRILVTGATGYLEAGKAARLLSGFAGEAPRYFAAWKARGAG